MARPIPFDPPRVDQRAQLLAKLERAPAEHAAALLDVYETLEALHDRGALDLVRGALGSGNEVLDIIVTATQSPDSIRGIRNLLLVVKMLGTIDPDVLKAFTQAVPQAFGAMVHEPQPPGLWSLIKDFLWNPDFRNGLSALNTMLSAFGRSLSGANKKKEDSDAPR